VHRGSAPAVVPNRHDAAARIDCTQTLLQRSDIGLSSWVATRPKVALPATNVCRWSPVVASPLAASSAVSRKTTDDRSATACRRQARLLHPGNQTTGGRVTAASR
jgi:hypothetical protein